MARVGGPVPERRAPGLGPPAWWRERRTEPRRSGAARGLDVGWGAGRSDRAPERLGRPKARHSPVLHRFAPCRVPPLRSPLVPPRYLDKRIGVGCGDFTTLWA